MSGLGVDLAAAVAQVERLLAARGRRVGLARGADGVVARVWCGPDGGDYAQLTEDVLRALVACARDALDGPGVS